MISTSASPPPESRFITSLGQFAPPPAPPSSRLAGVDREMLDGTGRLSSRAAEREAPASEPTTIRVPEALDRDPRRLSDIAGLEAGQRMRETGAADEESR